MAKKKKKKSELGMRQTYKRTGKVKKSDKK